VHIEGPTDQLFGSCQQMTALVLEQLGKYICQLDMREHTDGYIGRVIGPQ
jgi:hypothetical protein